MTTPVSTWAAAFDQAHFPWLKTFPIGEVFGPRDPNGRFPCRLCEDWLYDIGPEFPRLNVHRNVHHNEYAKWQREQKAQMEMVA